MNYSNIIELLDIHHELREMILKSRKETIEDGEEIIHLYLVDLAEELEYTLRNSLFQLDKLRSMCEEGYSKEDVVKFNKELKNEWEEQGGALNIRSESEPNSRRFLVSFLGEVQDDSN